MFEWWNGLEPVNQWFYGAAFFFTAIFLWQFISSLIGLSGDAEADLDAETAELDSIEAHSLEEAVETAAAFKILSIRAILAFCTMFAWTGALYLNVGKNLSTALVYAVGWGAAGWVVVAVLMNFMRRLTETGSLKIATCLGNQGTVYLNIPAGGQGEVRVLVSGRVTIVKARSAADDQIDAGTPVRVVRTLDTTTVEVETLKDKGQSSRQEDA